MKLRSDKNKVIQVELKQVNLYTGKIDGLWGVKSQTAYNQYKQQKTVPYYLNLHDDQDYQWNKDRVPDWFIIAWDERLNQVHELPGNQHHPDIIKYGTSVDLHVTTDEVPWCSSFVNWCISQTNRTTTKSALARSWLSYGFHSEIRLGSVVIFKRGKSSIFGHVGFAMYHEKEFNRIHVLGGNQSDAVTVQAYSESDLLDCRWSV